MKDYIMCEREEGGNSEVVEWAKEGLNLILYEESVLDI